MKWIMILTLLISGQVLAATEAFVIELKDRQVKVVSPSKQQAIFAVTVHNKSLSDTIGKFMAGGKDLQFVTIKSSESKTVEFKNTTIEKVHFVPLSPAGQDIPLEFGAKEYAIPPQE